MDPHASSPLTSPGPDKPRGTQRTDPRGSDGTLTGIPSGPPPPPVCEFQISQAERGEDAPDSDTFEPSESPQQPRSEPESLLLEKRGVTSHPQQGVIWESNVIFRDSILAKLRSIGKVALAGKMQDCHQVETFKQCTGCKKKTSFWNRCDLLFCPICAPRLGRERKESIEWWTKLINQPKHLVLTCRNTADLTEEYVKFLKNQLAKFRRSRCMRPVKGGCYSLEVTNEGRGWHVHFHLLVDACWLDMGEVSRTWGKLVGQDYAIVKIKDCRGGDYLREVTKYAVKGSELAGWSAAQIATFIQAFSGVRLFGVFGSLFGKRTEWREWIDAVREVRSVCTCGCSSWRLMSTDRKIWEEEVGPLNASLPPPPKILLPVEHPELALNLSRRVFW